MSKTKGTKTVQTRLTKGEYETFKRLAEREGLSIKDALREAAEDFIEGRTRVDPDDPMFTFHERTKETFPDDAEATDAAEMDDDLYGDDPR
ncbi:hypothetical protein ACFQPA_09955 [Halomarina halobia]|uniref:Ribbon-helix-helix protein, CopG family n=1 Tax=Halomarina halobia TaxID=3033386 RepID=A0ABD6AAJ0_9EURY|nr:hypothetical protein [Halomarina sp. PSR21]